MAIPGNYYIVDVSKADRLNIGKTREPLNPSDTSNLRRNKEGTQFVISSTETIPGANYVQKFATRSAMIDFITSDSDWILDDMSTTRTEQTAVDFKSITGIDRDTLVKAWIPKQIMYAGTAESATTVSEGFVAGENCDTDELAIRRWKDINTGATATITNGYVGGENSSYNTLYNAYGNSMIHNPGRNSILDLGVETVLAAPWTILCGFQPGDSSRMIIHLLGDGRTSLRFQMDGISQIKFIHRSAEGEETILKTFLLSINQVIAARGSTVQMYPVFIQWDGETLTIPTCSRSEEGETTYSITELNQYTPEEAIHQPVYPTSFTRTNLDTDTFHNARMTEIAGPTLMVGCYAVWGGTLSTSDMALLDNYILGL